MKQLNFQTKLNYTETYILSNRHKKPRVRLGSENIDVSIPSFEIGELPLAFVVKDYNRKTKYYFHDGSLYVKCNKRHFVCGKDGAVTVAMLKTLIKRKGFCSGIENRLYDETTINVWDDETKDYRLNKLNCFIEKFIVIGNNVYEKANEPMYYVITFGLGHNHAGIGTSLSISNHYNPNISKNNYFNALQRKEAISKAKDVAKRRGDTDSLKYIGKSDIKVLMPEVIKRTPQLEHGEGCSFTNKMEALIENSESPIMAGLLVMSNCFAN